MIASTPTFGPPVGVAGHVTTIRFVGSNDKDFVVMQEKSTSQYNCLGASAALLGAKILGFGEYDGTFKFPQVLDSSINTSAVMNEIADLVVCYASFESGGDSDDDYVRTGLPEGAVRYSLTSASSDLGYFKQVSTPDWSPKRMISGAKQNLKVLEAVIGDMVAWVYPNTSCNSTLLTTTPATDKKTVNYTLTSSPQAFQLTGDERSEDWELCYLPRCVGRTCMNKKDGVWTKIKYSAGELMSKGGYNADPNLIPTKLLLIIPRPAFAPLLGIAGSVTPLTFTGSFNRGVVAGDYAVVRPTDCSDAHLTVTTSSSVLPQALKTIAIGTNLLILTTKEMTDNIKLVVCFATKESVASMGNSDDDYVILSSFYTQITPVQFNPDRTISQAPQKFVVTGGKAGDILVWVTTPDCTYGTTDDGILDYNVPFDMMAWNNTDKTNPFTIAGSPFAVTLHTNPPPSVGTWYMCYKPFGGLWTLVKPWSLTSQGGFSRDLAVIAKPRFSPSVGVAGSSTPIEFVVGFVGDMIVMQPTNCNNAHLSVTGIDRLKVQSIFSITRVALELYTIYYTIYFLCTCLYDIICYSTFQDPHTRYFSLDSNKPVLLPVITETCPLAGDPAYHRV